MQQGCNNLLQKYLAGGHYENCAAVSVYQFQDLFYLVSTDLIGVK